MGKVPIKDIMPMGDSPMGIMLTIISSVVQIDGIGFHRL